MEDDGGTATLFDRPVGPGRSVTEEVDLEKRAGAIVRLELANAGPQGVVWLTSIRLTVPAAPKAPPRAARASGTRPNIVLYVVDTLRADYLGAYGHEAPTSPRLDAFAREAVLFEDAWAQASWTRSAMASVLTGLHVLSHGVDREDRVLSPSARTLGEALRAGGYRTGAFVANHLLGGRFGFDQGFDVWNPTPQTLYGAPAPDLVRAALAWVDTGSPSLLLVRAHHGAALSLHAQRGGPPAVRRSRVIAEPRTPGPCCGWASSGASIRKASASSARATRARSARTTALSAPSWTA